MQTRIPDLLSVPSVASPISLPLEKAEEKIHLEEKILEEGNLKEGPRQKGLATYHLEKIIQRLLDPNACVQFSYNACQELEVEFDGNLFNVSQILEHADFDSVCLTDEDLDAYVVFVKKKAFYKPLINNRLPTEQDYLDKDLLSECTHLHYAEKLAITLYTKSVYTAIQEFLRKNGKLAIFSGPFHEKSNLLLAELLLGIGIASHGLKKPLSRAAGLHVDKIQSTRFERVNFTSDFIQERKSAHKDTVNKSVLSHKGFTSSAHSLLDGKSIVGGVNCKTFIKQPNGLNPTGKRVQVLSVWENENEILFPPKTQFQYTGLTETKDMLEFHCRPVSTIENHDPYAYSSMIHDHELHVIDEMLKKIL